MAPIMPRGVSFSDIFFNLLGSQSAGDKTGRRVTKKKKNAVRQTGVSQHNGGPDEGSPETPQYHTVLMFERFQGGRRWARIMPRDASFPNSKCKGWHSVSGRCSFPMVSPQTSQHYGIEGFKGRESRHYTEKFKRGPSLYREV